MIPDLVIFITKNISNSVSYHSLYTKIILDFVSNFMLANRFIKKKDFFKCNFVLSDRQV